MSDLELRRQELRRQVYRESLDPELLSTRHFLYVVEWEEPPSAIVFRRR